MYNKDQPPSYIDKKRRKQFPHNDKDTLTNNANQVLAFEVLGSKNGSSIFP